MKIEAYENISNEALGAKIKRSYQRHYEIVQENTAVWQQEGQEYRGVRENLNIRACC